jgi:hypothetical protein
MNKKQITHWLKVAVIGIALGFALQFVRAWTEPTEAPPGGNVGAPINTGAQTQTKAGGLNIGGRLKVGENMSNPAGEAGQIRWTGADFEGFKGGAWVSLTSGGSSSDNSAPVYQGYCQQLSIHNGYTTEVCNSYDTGFSCFDITKSPVFPAYCAVWGRCECSLGNITEISRDSDWSCGIQVERIVFQCHTSNF